VRFPRETRDSVDALKQLPIITSDGTVISLSLVADIEVEPGPSMIKSEDAQPSVWVYVDVRGRDMVGFVKEAQRKVAASVKLPPGYAISWSGQYEYAQRAAKRLEWVVPGTIGIIFLLLFIAFRRVRQPAIILASLPFALVGGIWLIFLLGQAVSVASAVGFIALAGLSSEFGVIMLVYLNLRSGCDCCCANEWSMPSEVSQNAARARVETLGKVEVATSEPASMTRSGEPFRLKGLPHLPCAATQRRCVRRQRGRGSICS
jgi:Cu(I)/Ag(I) efflux system membrane protein CusA/SilA